MSEKKPTLETHTGTKTEKTQKKPAKSSKEKTEKEIGGYADSGLLEPTRFGDWEVKGRCSDF